MCRKQTLICEVSRIFAYIFIFRLFRIRSLRNMASRKISNCGLCPYKGRDDNMASHFKYKHPGRTVKLAGTTPWQGAAKCRALTMVF
jgi:hypothetical protein